MDGGELVSVEGRRIVVTGLVSATLASALRVALVWTSAPVWAFAAVGTLEIVVLLMCYCVGVPDRLRLSKLRAAFGSCHSVHSCQASRNGAPPARLKLLSSQDCSFV